MKDIMPQLPEENDIRPFYSLNPDTVSLGTPIEKLVDTLFAEILKDNVFIDVDQGDSLLNKVNKNLVWNHVRIVRKERHFSQSSYCIHPSIATAIELFVKNNKNIRIALEETENFFKAKIKDKSIADEAASHLIDDLISYKNGNNITPIMSAEYILDIINDIDNPAINGKIIPMWLWSMRLDFDNKEMTIIEGDNDNLLTSYESECSYYPDQVLMDNDVEEEPNGYEPSMKGNSKRVLKHKNGFTYPEPKRKRK